jgi:hypothetical protein
VEPNLGKGHPVGGTRDQSFDRFGVRDAPEFRATETALGKIRV